MDVMDFVMYRRFKIDFRQPFSVGMLLTLVGAFSDAFWHLSGLAAKEGFFTPAHGVLYTGVLIMGVSIVLLWWKRVTLLAGLIGRRERLLLLLGVGTMAAGGTWDFIYHSIHGFVDVVAWTPPHLTTTAGFVILLSTAILTLARKSTQLVKLAFALSVVLFLALWTMVIYITA